MPIVEFALMTVGVLVIITCFLTAKTLFLIWVDLRKMLPVDDAGTSDEMEARSLPLEANQNPFAALNRVCRQIAAVYELSPREEEMLPYFARGKSCTSIAEELNIGTATVKTHSSNIYQKLGVHSRDELIMLVERRLLP